MNGEIFTKEDVARYLRVPEKIVDEWVRNNEIPFFGINNEARFRKSEIEKWVDEKFAEDNPPTLISGEYIKAMLSRDRILFLQCSDKKTVLNMLADNLSRAPQVKNKEELVNGILRREDLMSTAIGKGIAIPHIRLNSITDLVVSIGICKNDVSGFVALDDKPVRLLIMIAAAYNQHAYYLQTLSYFSKRLKKDTLRNELLNASNANDVIRILAD